MSLLQLLSRSTAAAPPHGDSIARFDRVREQLPVTALLLLQASPASSHSPASVQLMVSLCELLAAAEAAADAARERKAVACDTAAAGTVPPVASATRIDQRAFTRETVGHFVAVKRLAARLRRTHKQVLRLSEEMEVAAQQLEARMKRELLGGCSAFGGCVHPTSSTALLCSSALHTLSAQRHDIRAHLQSAQPAILAAVAVASEASCPELPDGQVCMPAAAPAAMSASAQASTVAAASASTPVSPHPRPHWHTHHLLLLPQARPHHPLRWRSNRSSSTIFCCKRRQPRDPLGVGAAGRGGQRHVRPECLRATGAGGGPGRWAARDAQGRATVEARERADRCFRIVLA